MQTRELIGRIENILFAAGDAVEIIKLAQYFGIEEDTLAAAIDEECERRMYEYGLVIKRVGDKVQLCTRPESAEDIYSLLGKRSQDELTRAMLETLAIIAYKQPITRVEVEEIRGVNSSYIIGNLLEKKLIREAGRKQVLGRPILYETDDEFLRHFGLADISELPELPETGTEE